MRSIIILSFTVHIHYLESVYKLNGFVCNYGMLLSRLDRLEDLPAEGTQMSNEFLSNLISKKVLKDVPLFLCHLKFVIDLVFGFFHLTLNGLFVLRNDLLKKVSKLTDKQYQN